MTGVGLRVYGEKDVCKVAMSDRMVAMVSQRSITPVLPAYRSHCQPMRHTFVSNVR